MAHHVIEYDKQCASCKGTGLYVGLGERDGSAVVCHTCKGAGHHAVRHEYDDFEGLRKRDDVRRVVRVNPGIVIGEDEKSTLKLEDFGGISYEDWLDGKAFPDGSEDRAHTCPAWFYQIADYDRKPCWDKCCFGYFGDCKHFPDKAACWMQWDREQADRRNAKGGE